MNKKILITGGGKGLGAALVTALANAGYDVTFTVRSSLASGEALVEQLKQNHPAQNFNVLTLDCAESAAVKAFAEKAAEETYYGFIHNAGATYDMLAAMMDEEQAKTVMQVNFYALTTLAKALIRPMSRAKTGRIIAIGSIAALRGSQGNAAYAASKAAIMGYMQTLSVETGRRNITCNTIAPGFIETDMLNAYAAYKDTMVKQIPLQRFARAEEVASLATYLCSEGASYITGTTFAVDGGLTAQLGLQR